VDWAKAAGIQISPEISLASASQEAGLGWFRKQQQQQSSAAELKAGSVLISVPSSVALTVESPGSGPDDSTALSSILRDNRDGRKDLEGLPWFVQMSLYLYKLDRVSATKKPGRGSDINLRPWLDSLPRTMSTPIHWNSLAREALQYESMVRSVRQQEITWKENYFAVAQKLVGPALTWEQFLWGAEMARSRAFSGAYTGRPFNPFLYAFTLLLVAAYVGLNVGTIEQAANGAGVVLCAIVLQDFVVPKLFKRKRYVICPMIDMANHQSANPPAGVSFEFFGDAYSLAVSSSDGSTSSNGEICISYGPRSNDQLLQYYGFVEVDNPNDVYVMPPLREWDVSALERSCGRIVEPGRLGLLDRAGLLGRATTDDDRDAPDGGGDGGDDGDASPAANQAGGVVLTRSVGLDPAVLQALRALLSTEDEWDTAGRAIGSFATENSGGPANERCARLAARAAIELELRSKPTTLEEDVALLRRMEAASSLDVMGSAEERLAIQFRIEKKKLLLETMDKLT
jgi:Rubisco LSMT substrate-binding